MNTSWDQQLDNFWNTSAEKTAEQLRAELADLLRGMDPNDPRVLFEIASLHDFLGEEAQAVQPYRQALQGSLHGQKREEALIQLASTLRNLGETEETISLLAQVPTDSALHTDAQGFLALALFDAGREAEAVVAAVTALAPKAQLYSRALDAYARDIAVPDVGAHS